MTEVEKCVFCDIREGRLEADLVLDETNVLAFLDRRPVFPGHVLVVPRMHHRNLFELPKEETGALFSTVQRVSHAVKKAMGADGILVISNNGVSQSVDHLHIHVIPRRKKDGLRGFMWPRLRYLDNESETTASEIRKELALL